MKKIIFALTIAFTSLSFVSDKSPVKWLSFEEAIALNKKEKKPFIIDVYTDWCGWCKVMDRKTYADKYIAGYINKNFYPIKFNAEQREQIEYLGKTFKFVENGRKGYHELAVSLLGGKLSYPTTVFLDKDEKMIDRIPGYLTKEKIEPILAFIFSNAYKKKSYDSFLNQFESQLTSVSE